MCSGRKPVQMQAQHTFVDSVLTLGSPGHLRAAQRARARAGGTIAPATSWGSGMGVVETRFGKVRGQTEEGVDGSRDVGSVDAGVESPDEM